MLIFLKKTLLYQVLLLSLLLIYLVLYLNLGPKTQTEDETHQISSIKASPAKNEATSSDRKVKVLIIYDEATRPRSLWTLDELSVILSGLKIEFKLVKYEKFVAILTYQSKHASISSSNYSLFIFVSSYQLLNSEMQEFLLDYCTKNMYGILRIETSRDLTSFTKCFLNELDDFYKITKFIRHENFLFDRKNGSIIYEAYSFKSQPMFKPVIKCDDESKNFLLKSDSPRQVLIGLKLSDLMLNLFIDCLSFLTYDRISSNHNKYLNRYIQVDIDDLFVGTQGLKLKLNDVTKLIDFQENYLNKNVFLNKETKFRFNLGYSGYYFNSSQIEDENRADFLILGKKNRFFTHFLVLKM
jgi:hypothetical protein